MNSNIESKRACGFTNGALCVMASAVISACSPSNTIDLGENSTTGSGASKPVVLNVASAMGRINKIRSSHGLSRISTDTKLMKAARIHARLMAKHGRMSHSFGPGTGFAHRMKEVGFAGSAGENLGIGYKSAEAAIQGWMDSPPHRKIMLRRNFNIGGIGLAKNPTARKKNYWVLVLGSNGGPSLNGVQ